MDTKFNFIINKLLNLIDIEYVWNLLDTKLKD